MDYSNRVIASLFLLQVFCSRVMGTCKLIGDTCVNCQGVDIVDLNTALKDVQGRTRLESALFIDKTPLATIENEIISTGNFTTIVFSKNAALTYIAPSAFTSLVKEFYISGSSELKDGIWDVVKPMSAITTLTLNNVGLTTVTPDAFLKCSLSKSIKKIFLPNNKIATFGASLQGLTLEKLDLNNNNLNENSFTLGIFEGANIETLSLTNNRDMTRLNESQFKGLLEANNKIQISVGNGRDNFVKNSAYMRCKGARWLCEKDGEGQYKYKNKVKGYLCSDSTGENIFDYCESPLLGLDEPATDLETAPNVYALL